MANTDQEFSKIGVDLGGTRIKAGLVRGRILERSLQAPTNPTQGPERLLSEVARLVLELDPKPLSVGFAIPGEVDEHGRCYGLPNIPGFTGLEVASELQRRLGCPVQVENDATSAALGEALYGSGQRYQNFLLVMLGTGVGGGLVLNGQVRRGATGFCGEIGRVRIRSDEDAPIDITGTRGSIEAYAGTKGLLDAFRSFGGVASEVREIAASARRGEEPGLRTLSAMGRQLGEALAVIQHILDLDAIIFSGGISLSFDLLEPHIRAGLTQHTYMPHLGQVPLLASELGDLAGLFGAANLSRLC